MALGRREAAGLSRWGGGGPAARAGGHPPCGASGLVCGRWDDGRAPSWAAGAGRVAGAPGAQGAEARSVSVLGELCGPGAVPANGAGFHLYTAGHAFRGAGVEVRSRSPHLPPGHLPPPHRPPLAGQAGIPWKPGLASRIGAVDPHPRRLFCTSSNREKPKTGYTPHPRFLVRSGVGEEFSK